MKFTKRNIMIVQALELVFINISYLEKQQIVNNGKLIIIIVIYGNTTRIKKHMYVRNQITKKYFIKFKK